MVGCIDVSARVGTERYGLDIATVFVESEGRATCERGVAWIHRDGTVQRMREVDDFHV